MQTLLSQPFRFKCSELPHSLKLCCDTFQLPSLPGELPAQEETCCRTSGQQCLWTAPPVPGHFTVCKALDYPTPQGILALSQESWGPPSQPCLPTYPQTLLATGLAFLLLTQASQGWGLCESPFFRVSLGVALYTPPWPPELTGAFPNKTASSPHNYDSPPGPLTHLCITPSPICWLGLF